MEAFLSRKIGFNQIMEVVNNAYTNSGDIDESDIKEILLLDGMVRSHCHEYIEKIAGV